MSTLLLIVCVAFLDDAPTGTFDRDASLSKMQERAKVATVKVQSARPITAKLHEKPLFRYSDEERKIEDGTLWAFEDQGRPFALQKVEHYPTFPVERRWLYCFSSLATDTVQADWPGEQTYESKSAGLEWKELPNAPALASTAAVRLTQLRTAARRFSARLERSNTVGGTNEMRLISTPLHRYTSKAHRVLDGALFGLTATGTNPDVVIALEIDDANRWRYGVNRMTLEGLSVKLDEKEVWTCPHLQKGATFDTWLYFYPK